jgi:hypothetical protein
MITQSEAIEILNQANASDLIEINQGLTNEVLLAPVDNLGDGITPDQRADVTEYLNEISFVSGLDINSFLNSTAVAGKHPCD